MYLEVSNPRREVDDLLITRDHQPLRAPQLAQLEPLAVVAQPHDEREAGEGGQQDIDGETHPADVLGGLVANGSSEAVGAVGVERVQCLWGGSGGELEGEV